MTEKANCPLIVSDSNGLTDKELLIVAACKDDLTTANPLMNFQASLNQDGSGFAMFQCLNDLSHPDKAIHGPIKPMTTPLTRDVEIKAGGLVDELPLILTSGAQQEIAKSLADAFEAHCQTGLPIAQTTMVVLPKR